MFYESQKMNHEQRSKTHTARMGRCPVYVTRLSQTFMLRLNTQNMVQAAKMNHGSESGVLLAVQNKLFQSIINE